MKEEIELKGRLDGRQRNRLKSLLNMKYRPREIAEEVGFSVHQVYRVYIPLECPFGNFTLVPTKGLSKGVFKAANSLKPKYPH